jgi:hypothetical protein
MNAATGVLAVWLLAALIWAGWQLEHHRRQRALIRHITGALHCPDCLARLDQPGFTPCPRHDRTVKR